jgi:hypothetical protein
MNLAAAAQFGIATIEFESAEQCSRQLHEKGFI